MTDTTPSIVPDINESATASSRRQPPLPADQCPVLFNWHQVGLYMGCSADSARSRYNRKQLGDLKVSKPTGWNCIMVVKAELDAVLLDIAGRSRTRPRD
ncbi:hypothetical protein IF803_23205 [Bradyrhizobium sp. UFLA06-06]